MFIEGLPIGFDGFSLAIESFLILCLGASKRILSALSLNLYIPSLCLIMSNWSDLVTQPWISDKHLFTSSTNLFLYSSSFILVLNSMLFLVFPFRMVFNWSLFILVINGTTFDDLWHSLTSDSASSIPLLTLHGGCDSRWLLFIDSTLSSSCFFSSSIFLLLSSSLFKCSFTLSLNSFIVPSFSSAVGNLFIMSWLWVSLSSLSCSILSFASSLSSCS